ncbi:hypothetical protein D5086_024240 [Populus alba]|uniref:Uncharacterized protein n=2 Tax=Populus alba TaxID=43335 RepID=A0ACC4B4X1_POPAL|nr:myosin heavy chain kinase B-like [Populus alba]
MDFYGRKSLFSFITEERNAPQELNDLELQFSPPRPVKNAPIQFNGRVNAPIQTSANMAAYQEMNDQELQFSPPRPSTTHSSKLTLLPPSSPESPWTLSPHRTPSPSLLYHCIASLHRHEGNIYSIAVSKGIVFTGSESNRIRAWKQPDCMERGYLKARSGEIRAILAYGNILFSAHKDLKIRVWNFAVSDNFRAKKLKFGGFLTKKCVDSFVAHEDSVNALLVNQDDGCVFTCSVDGSVKLWRRVYRENSHTLTMTLKFQQSPVNALALSSSFNNCFLYSGSSDGTINFWEKEKFSGRFNHGGFLQGHRFAVLCLVAIEKLLFSGSEDTTIRVWRREEGSYLHECLAVLDGHRGPVRCLAACLEMEKVVMGFLVYSASLDQTFKVWRVKVLPEEKRYLDYREVSDSRSKVMEYEMSPVLSPSWVKKKLKGDYFQ